VPGALADRLARLNAEVTRLNAEVTRLGREQFRAVTLLEGLGAALDEVVDGREQRGGAPADLFPPLAELESRLRRGLIADLLPVADAVAAGVRTAPELLAELQAEKGPRPALDERGALLEAWLQGALLTEGRLLALFERDGVRPIPTVGQPFDPHRHVAVAVAGDGGVPDGTVVGEELRGYAAGDRVLRHAEVVVARTASPPPTEEQARRARAGGGEGSTGAGTGEGDAP
jgi:hypothetical protein